MTKIRPVHPAQSIRYLYRNVLRHRGLGIGALSNDDSISVLIDTFFSSSRPYKLIKALNNRTYYFEKMSIQL